ncbi:MAG: hypothetical protein HC877_23975 [Thioploca sp.]|nr:hypothetical protein [Thioploca sp.]
MLSLDNNPHFQKALEISQTGKISTFEFYNTVITKKDVELLHQILVAPYAEEALKYFGNFWHFI